MPHIVFVRKSGEQVRPTTVDDEIRDFFKVDNAFDVDEFYCDWFAIIGQRLTDGKSWNQIHVDFENQCKETPDQESVRSIRQLTEVAKWIATNFTEMRVVG